MFKESVMIYKDTASIVAETLPFKRRQEIAAKQMKIPSEMSKVYMIHRYAAQLQNVTFDERLRLCINPCLKKSTLSNVLTLTKPFTSMLKVL